MCAIPTIDDILSARERIQPWVHVTPLVSNTSLNRRYGCTVHFKMENLQRVGAFKARGAHNAVFSLSEEQIKQGVCTHSSGNHAQALALAARNRGVAAYIVMPRTAPKVKVAAVQEYGANITFCEPNLDAREEAVARVVSKSGATVVHPYDNADIIAGQASVAAEVFEQADNPVDTLLCPVGGGGLLGGTLLASKYFSPSTTVIAAEPSGANDAWKGMQTGRRVESHNPNTICDGLLTTVGELNFAIMQQEQVTVVTVSDADVLEELQSFWQRTKSIIEPSSAVVLAAMRHPDVAPLLQGRHVCAIISGGNADIALASQP